LGTSDDGGPAGGPEILSEAPCTRFLELADLGRVITSRGGFPGVSPVTYCVDDRSVFFRSSQGTSRSEISADAVAGFEVDELDRASALRFRVVALHGAESMFRFVPDAISGQLVRSDPRETQPNAGRAPLLDESWLTR